MWPQGIEWVFVIQYYAVYWVLPVLALVAAVLVIWRMATGIKVRGLTTKGEDAVAKAAARGTQDALEVTTAASAPAFVASVPNDKRLMQARVELALADAGLTKRERTVLLATLDGKSLADVAEELEVSRSTTGTYATRAYEKLGVSGKDEAAAWVARCICALHLADAGLTEREVEVAQLAADGASSADIAAKLVLSEDTVNTHLQQVYNKLGVHTRADLTVRLKELEK